MVLEPETLTALMHCSFPGNLVELRSALIWATLMTDGISILPDHLPPRIHESSLSNS
jgi:DNA-binding NtrC family response regulator